MKTSETKKGGRLILDNSYYPFERYHSFPKRKEFTGDFRYDTQTLVNSLGEEDRRVFIEEIKIPELFEETIGASNRIEFFKEQSFFRFSIVTPKYLKFTG